MTDIKNVSTSIPKEFFHDPILPSPDQLFLDRLKIEDNLSNLPKISQYIAGKFDLREKDVETSLRLILQHYDDLNNHIFLSPDRVDDAGDESNAPVSKRYNYILINKKATGEAVFNIVEQQQRPLGLELMQRPANLAILPNPMPVFLEFKPMKAKNENRPLTNIVVRAYPDNATEQYHPDVFLNGRLANFTAARSNVEQAKNTLETILKVWFRNVKINQKRKIASIIK